MRYTIQQTEAGWVLARADGDVLTQLGDPFVTYDAALLALAAQLAAEEAADDDGEGSADGLLAEAWTDDGGIAFSEALPGGRDFTGCTWSWRDPSTALLPLMLQTSTDYGHFGAQLAGFIEALSESGGTVHGSGRFYDTEQGRAARDLLLDGRRFGVSVDPSEDVEVEFVCTETDDDGWCVEGMTAFIAYEIAGLTMTPFPGFENAAIVLGTSTPSSGTGNEAPADDTEEEPADEEAAAIRASLHVAAPTVPDAEAFHLPEPQMGQPFMGTLGDEFLVDQGDGTVACPLTITDEGTWFGHLARWEQCHVGDPAGPGICVTPPRSLAAYAHFHVGAVRCTDGSTEATGALTVGCEHADLGLTAWQARDHYANAGNGWADGRVVDGEYGAWGCGVLRPDVGDAELRVLRALSLSGDWRKIGRGLELIAALSVNVPGFPIARESLAASGLSITAAAMPGSRTKRGEVEALVASGIVARCPDCQARQQAALAAGAGQLRTAPPDPRIDRVLALVERVERRTRHLVATEAAATRARLGG